MWGSCNPEGQSPKKRDLKVVGGLGVNPPSSSSSSSSRVEMRSEGEECWRSSPEQSRGGGGWGVCVTGGG